MGALSSRRRGDEEAGEASQDPASAQRGLYFGPHIVMGGQRFATSSPETFLFGGLGTDLGALSNFAMNRMPHPIPDLQATTTIKSFVNLKKSSVHLVRTDNPARYKIDFKFDCDKECAISVYFVAKESMEDNSIVYSPIYSNSTCPPVSFSPGMNQSFSLPESTLLDISRYKIDELMEEDEEHPKLIHPIVILLETKNENNDRKSIQSQSTFATLVKSGEDNYDIKVFKQKVTVDGVTYILQEIFGIDHNPDAQEPNAEENLENTRECVVCMSDPKDTIALPCRHMCICSQCAEQLRYQSNKCPICRQPFHSLLQIKISEPKDANTAEDKPVDVVVIPIKSDQTDAPSNSTESQMELLKEEDTEEKLEEKEEEKSEEKLEEKTPEEGLTEESTEALKNDEDKTQEKTPKPPKVKKSKSKKDFSDVDENSEGQTEEKRKKKGKSKAKAENSDSTTSLDELTIQDKSGSSHEITKKKKKKSQKQESTLSDLGDD